MLEQLTDQDLTTLIEALDSWTSASKRDSMLTGLLLGAMVSSNSNSPDAGADVFKRSMDGEEEKKKTREEIATLLKAKLIQARDRLAVREVARSIS